MKAIIYLKHNPTPIEVDVTKIESRTNEENFTHVSWTTPDGYSVKIHDFVLNEIAFITVKNEEA